MEDLNENDSHLHLKEKKGNKCGCVETQEEAKAEVSGAGEVNVTGAERSLEEILKRGTMKTLDSKHQTEAIC